MLKLTYGHLRNPMFSQGLRKIANWPGFETPKQAYNVAKINRQVRAEAATCDSLFEKMVRKYADVNANGEIIPQEGMPGSFRIPDENEEAWKKEFAEFEEIEFDVPAEKIDANTVAGAKLTPMELDGLEPIVHFLELKK